MRNKCQLLRTPSYNSNKVSPKNKNLQSSRKNQQTKYLLTPTASYHTSDSTQTTETASSKPSPKKYPKEKYNPWCHSTTTPSINHKISTKESTVRKMSCSYASPKTKTSLAHSHLQDFHSERNPKIPKPSSSTSPNRIKT